MKREFSATGTVLAPIWVCGGRICCSSATDSLQ